MKKSLRIFLAILLLIAIVFGVAGCGKKEEEKSEDKIKNETAQVENKNNEETVKFTRGEWNGDTYTNEFLGLNFKLPSKWTSSTDEEMATLMGIGTDVLTDNEDDKAALEEYMEQAVVYGMMANNASTGDNVIIQFQKVASSYITEKALTDSMKAQLEAVDGINYDIEETKTEKLCGKEYTTIIAKAEMNGIKRIQKYYINVQGEYASYVIITATSNANLENTISNFSEI